MARQGRDTGGKTTAIAAIVVAAVVVAAIVALVLPRGGSSPAELVALVHDGDGGVRELALSEDSETVVVTSLGENVVVVADGAVCVREADCDNQDCVHQGPISAPGHQVICLPHKLWIEVVARGDSGGEMDTSAVPGAEGYDLVAR